MVQESGEVWSAPRVKWLARLVLDYIVTAATRAMPEVRMMASVPLPAQRAGR